MKLCHEKLRIHRILKIKIILVLLLFQFSILHKYYRFVAGVINRERIPAFERLLWRACRGNVFFKQAEIATALYDPGTGDLTNKCVFIVFFQGEQLKIRVKKICEG